MSNNNDFQKDFSVGSLLEAGRELIFVARCDSLAKAITLMQIYNYSQLPVMETKDSCIEGVISWKSIGVNMSLKQQTCNANSFMEWAGQVKVCSFMYKKEHIDQQIVEDSKIISEIAKLVFDYDFVLVKKSDKIKGIITASDLAVRYSQLMRVLELEVKIEKKLKCILAEKGKDFSNSSLGNIKSHLKESKNWNDLKLPADRETFCKELGKLTRVRNEHTHEHKNLRDPNKAEFLQTFLEFLKRLAQNEGYDEV